MKDETCIWNSTTDSRSIKSRTTAFNADEKFKLRLPFECYLSALLLYTYVVIVRVFSRSFQSTLVRVLSFDGICCVQKLQLRIEMIYKR